MFRNIGPTEVMIILAVVMLLFGGRKLPEMARGSGRALRIFKSEIKGLHDDEDSAESAARNEDVSDGETDTSSPKDRKSDPG